MQELTLTRLGCPHGFRLPESASTNHGWRSSCVALQRSPGSGSKHFARKSRPSFENAFEGDGPCRVMPIWYNNARWLRKPDHGRLPVFISTTVQPRLHTSAFLPDGAWRVTGARRCGELCCECLPSPLSYLLVPSTARCPASWHHCQGQRTSPRITWSNRSRPA